MGAWEYGPIDNDTAADWIAVTIKKSKLPQLIKKGLNSKDEDEVRGAAFFLERTAYLFEGMGYDFETDELFDLAIFKLEGLLENDAWLDSWNSTRQIRASLNEQIRQLKTLKSERE